MIGSLRCRWRRRSPQRRRPSPWRRACLGFCWGLLLSGGAIALSSSAIAQVPDPGNAPALESPQPAISPAAQTSALSALSRWWQPTTQQLNSVWIRLDGVRLFQLSGWASSGLDERRRAIQRQLDSSVGSYLRDPAVAPTVEVRESNQQPVIYINDQYLLTVTELDAQNQGLSPQVWAEQVRVTLEQGLETAKTQRSPAFLWRQARLSLVVLMAVGLAIALLSRWHRWLLRRPIQLLQPSTTLLLKRRSRLTQTRQQEIQRLLLHSAQVGLGLSGLLFSLSRFPQSRAWLVPLGGLFKIPLGFLLCLLAGYVLVRLSHVAIDRFSLAISTNPLLPAVSTERTQQRISTLSQVVKGLTLLLISIFLVLVFLIWLGVNVGPLLTGAGILGVGISLASQGLIKDAINGVLVVLEDQYGVGDIIQVAEWTGLVEDLTLRMTQLRTSEGKLVTIPNGEIKVVANLSSSWSRVDLNIPVGYGAKLEAVMAVIEATAMTMAQEAPWDSLILEPPELKGVDDFSDRGLLIKLWIKTQPLKQWDVAREYRRRLKHALDQAGLEIPLPQRSFWLHASSDFNREDGELFATNPAPEEE